MFFDKGVSTEKVWFYQLNLARNLGKGQPLNEADLAEFVELQKTKADSENSWSIDTLALSLSNGFDLSVKNPTKSNEVILREPKEIINEIVRLDTETVKIISDINKII